MVKELETKVNEDGVERWDDGYLRYNASIGTRDESGRYPVENDIIALNMLRVQKQKATFRHANKTERMKFMIRQGFYRKDILRGGLTLNDVEELYQTYYDNDRGDLTYYSLLVFINSYAYKVTEGSLLKRGYTLADLPKTRFDDKYVLLEDKADRAVANALDVVGGLGKEEVLAVIEKIAKREYHPSTPSYGNSGIKDGGKKISCFILKFEDTIKSIADLDSYTLYLSKMGGGIGFDGTDIRALGEMVGELDNRAHGIIPIAKRIEQAVAYADQDGKRRGSAVFNLDVFHADIFRLLDAKKENTDESVRLSMLSVGVILRDKFMELFGKEEGFYTFYPHTIFQEYGIKLSDIDMTEMYDELVKNPRVRKEYHTFEEMKDVLAFTASESGYPYPLFRETMNENHIFKNATIYSSNLCTEIYQRMCEKYGVQCTLLSINIKEVMQNKSLRSTIRTATSHLNGVISETDLSDVPPVQRAMDDFRAIGIGTMNLHGYLANVGIPYESNDALDFVRVFYSNMNFESILASMELTEVYGKFKDFEDTTYADGTYFDQYLEQDFLPISDKVSALFEGMDLKTRKDWEWLKGQVKKKGLANAYRIAIAPNGTTSYASGATASIAPITQLVELRGTASMGSAYYAMPDLNPNNYMLYKDAYRVDDFKYMDLISAIQQHVDQGISTTLFITDNYTSADWWARVVYAWRIGLKNLYYTRPKISSFEECDTCTG